MHPSRRLMILERTRRYRFLIFGLVISWLLLTSIVIFIDPNSIKDIPIPNSYLIMATTLFFSIFFLFTLIFLDSARSLRLSLGLLVFFYLRVLGLGNLWTSIALFGLLTCMEIYFSWKS